MGGCGPQTDELIQVTEALQSYVERRSGESALIRAVARAERRLRISVSRTAPTSNQAMQPTANRPYAPLSRFMNVTCNSRGG